jgi:hypothetical protein
LFIEATQMRETAGEREIGPWIVPVGVDRFSQPAHRRFVVAKTGLCPADVKKPEGDHRVAGAQANGFEDVNGLTKLMRTYAAQMEALKRYRSGGEQKMTVQHVHVAEGGQAIVGNVNAPAEGAGRAKKWRTTPMHLDMHRSLRCHAKSKRSGLPCRAPGVRGCTRWRGGSEGQQERREDGAMVAESIELRREF